MCKMTSRKILKMVPNTTFSLSLSLSLSLSPSSLLFSSLLFSSLLSSTSFSHTLSMSSLFLSLPLALALSLLQSTQSVLVRCLAQVCLQIEQTMSCDIQESPRLHAPKARAVIGPSYPRSTSSRSSRVQQGAPPWHSI